jgi:hypothetical protein
MPFDNPFSRSLGITHLPASERFACPRASRQSRERCRGNLISIAGFFSFFQIGSGPYPLHPRNRGAGGSWGLCRPFNGTQNPDWVLVLARAVPRRAPFRGDPPRLNLSDFLSAMRTNSRNWGPIGLSEFNCRPQSLEMLICNSAIGNSNLGNWDPQFQLGAIGQLAIQPNSIPPIQ